MDDDTTSLINQLKTLTTSLTTVDNQSATLSEQISQHFGASLKQDGEPLIAPFDELSSQLQASIPKQQRLLSYIEALGQLLRPGARDDWHSPWRYARNETGADWGELRSRRAWGGFEGDSSADSWLVFGVRLLYLWLSVFTAWAWFYWLLVRELERPRWPLFQTLGRWRARYWVEDLLVFVSTGAVIGFAWRLVPALKNHHGWQIVIVLLLLWRLYGIGLLLIRVVVRDTLGLGYPHTEVSAVRYLLYIPFYAAQVVFIFAATYYTWASTGFHDPAERAAHLGVTAGVHPFSDYVYASGATLATFGGQFRSQWQLLEAAFGLALFGIGLATFVGQLRLKGRT